MPEFSYPIQVGDIIGNVKTAQRVLEEYAKNSSGLTAMTEKAAAFIRKNYSEEREWESIVSAWKRISGT